ncbi:molybdenum cofactor guanylyltransferase MobA [Candidatus Thioglobus sp.]|uniref:molybdenum cofactor guanylyltransferase MobA n=1 Tax=Candidatus Thioglobus sp. TaxID=2026721 RepID=UPI003D1175F5
MIDKNNITAVILAGGQGLRMNGQDKGLILLDNKPLIGHTVDIIDKSVSSILVSANRNLDLYQQFGKVVSDNLSNYQGPLAGICAALTQTNSQYLFIVPCDSPYIDRSLLERLSQAMIENNTKLCVVSENKHLHPTFALIDVAIKPVLDQYLAAGERKLGKFFKECGAIEVDFSDKPQLFINLNSPEDFINNTIASD